LPITELADGVVYSESATRAKLNEIIGALNTLTGEAAPGQVAVDSAATAGYLGATGATGTVRVTSPLAKADGGDFITFSIEMVLVTLGSDPLHATPASRPAGILNKLGLYDGHVYICTDATAGAPVWIVVGPPL
jgi:hypothetical protein